MKEKQPKVKVKSKKSLTKKQKKRIVMILALALLVLAACYTVFIAPLLEKEQWIYKEETVERGTLKVGVTESGFLEYGTNAVLYELDLDVSDDDDEDEEEEETEEETVQKYLKIAEMYVAAGQRIAEGDALCRLTEDSVADVRRFLESALVDAQSEYKDAEAEYRLSALEAETEFEISKMEAGYADDIYERADASVDNDIKAMQVEIEQRTADIASLQEKMDDAQEDYNDALEEYEDAKESAEQTGTDHAKNYMTIQDNYLNAQTKYENAKRALKQAQQNLEDNAEEIASLQRAVTAAQARITIDKLDVEATYRESVIVGENAEITYNAQIESLKETLQEAEKEKAKVEEQLAAFETFVGEDGTLYATEAGIVTEVAYDEGDRLINAGLILAYATPGDMTITVDVTQEDVVDLQVGDTVDITFRAYEDTPYIGTIQSIDTTATAQNSNTVSYTVVILVEGDTEALYGGMSADVIFVTEQKEDVLYISGKAIVNENGKTYVYRKNALGNRELAEVETGITNGVDIEIRSGLEEGDTIYLASRVSSEEEVTSTMESIENNESGFAIPEGMELPEGFEVPEGTDFGSGMPSGGGPGGSGTGMPSGGGPGGFGGGMPNGRNADGSGRGGRDNAGGQ